MKKLISLFLTLALLLGLACGALADDKTCGSLSYLNMTEEEDTAFGISIRRSLLKILFLHGVLEGDSDVDRFSGDAPAYRHYDTLDALLMALQSGEVKTIEVPYYTAMFLCATNENLKMKIKYHPENAASAAKMALGTLSDGYSFMMKEENTALRDEFDAQIAAMKEDGTLQNLIDEHIIKASETGEPVAIAFEQFEGDPIKVAVTGSLPPLDYVSADGSFAGFNTAVLAEIGKRLQKNIELVQVENVGRALALSEGVVDVVFWTRSLSEKRVDELVADRGLSDEEKEAKRAERRAAWTDEERAILESATAPTEEDRARLRQRDLPAGTIITRPYFSDFPVLVTLKEAE